MSLKHLADELAAKGRYGDTELVHMTKGEVAGLQSLAEAAGGSLTINPDTGKPEAFFLAALLPFITGGIGAAAGLGTLGTAALGAGVGALTNKENRGIGALTGMLGGIGGGQLANALGAAGAAGTTMGSALPGQAAAELATTEAAKQAVAAGATGQGSQAAMLAAQNMGAPTAQLATTTLAPNTMAAAGQGIAALGTEAGRSAALQSLGGAGGALKAAGMAAAPMIYDYMMPKQVAQVEEDEEKDTEDLMGRYKYESGYTGGTYEPGSAYTGERRYFRPSYVRAAQGGAVKKFADGGEASADPSVVDPARGMTGESADALRYLYGMAPQSPALEARMQPTQNLEVPTEASASQKYIFNPNTQQFLNNPAYVPPKTKTSSIFSGLFGMQQPTAPVYYDARGNVVPLYDASGQPIGGASPSFGGFGNLFGGSGFSEGGLASLARGGMKAGGFVVPADVVSMVGEGNTEAGYERIKRMLPGATPIKGKDGGQADTVKTSIEGKQPARIAHGEMYVPPAAVKRAGGAKKLYAMMKNVRQQAKGDAKQIKPVNLKKAMA
jgi:hypothetical protein